GRRGRRGASLFLRGVERCFDGRWAEAAVLLGKASALQPGSGERRFWRAAALSRLGRLRQARQELASAKALLPQDAWLEVWQGLLDGGLARFARRLRVALRKAPDDSGLHFLNASISRLSGLDAPGLSASLERALALDADNIWARLRLADLSWLCGDADGCLKQYGRALRRRPRWAVALAGRGEIYSLMGEASRAAKDLRAALRRQPRAAWVWALSGRLHYLSGRRRRCLQALGRAARLAPRSGWINAWLGQGLASALDDPAGARRRLDYALRLEPNYALALSWRGALNLREGRLAAAQADLSKAVSLNPTCAAHRAELARALRLRGRLRSALRQTKLAVRLSYVQTWAGRWLFDAAAEPRRHRQALEAIDQEVRRRPADAWALAWRGETLLAAGELSAALADLDAALRLDSGLAWAYAWRAEASFRSGRGAAAAWPDLRRALALDPSYGRARALAGRLWLEEGRFERAVRELDAVLRLDPTAGCPFVPFWRGVARLSLGLRKAAAADFRSAGDLLKRSDDARLLALRALEGACSRQAARKAEQAASRPRK
ncbi:MAG: hypothetical protein KGK30_06095, partial [Elusimicrobia bacterium]|nr:hypothetical protein [Elusimicrobiota bacterium]